MLGLAACSEGEGPGAVALPPASEGRAPAESGAVDLPETPEAAPQVPLRDLTIRVLLPTGEPAVEAPVRFLDTALVRRADLLRATGGEPDSEKLLEVLGEERLTDVDGRAVFSTSGGPMLASAELGSLYVMQPFAPLADDADGLTLTLIDDASVRAVAIGPAGQPVSGIPIALTMEFGAAGANPDAPRRWIDLAVRETSGHDGTVRFRDARGGVVPTSQGTVRFGLRAAIPGLDSHLILSDQPVLFDPDSVPPETLEIHVPALSTFVVEVISPSGQLVDMKADVFLESHSAPPGSPRLRTRLLDGRATFTAVVPGSLMRVTVQPLGGGSAFEGVGPSALRAGDVVTVSVSAPRDS